MNPIEIVDFVKRNNMTFRELTDNPEESLENNGSNISEYDFLKTIGRVEVYDETDEQEGFGKSSVVIRLDKYDVLLMEEFTYDRTGQDYLSVSYHQVVVAEDDTYTPYRKIKDLDEWDVE